MITIICGSQRQGSNSLKVAQYFAEQIKKQFAQETFLLDLTEHPLPLWGNPEWNDEEARNKLWAGIQDKLRASEGFIIITPEWHGMVPAALKNFFLYATAQELGHKPGLLVSVTSGISGSYPIAELRMSSYKNTFINYVPDHLVLRYVNQLFDETKAQEPIVIELRKRMQYSLNMFFEYVKALRSVRASGLINYNLNGM